MHGARESGEEIVRTARIDEGAESGGNDRTAQVAWAAGLFEGEGWITISARKPFGKNKSVAYSMVAGIVMTDPEILERFQAIFGGSLHATSEVNERYSPAYRVELYANKAASALREMLPYFGPRRAERARLAIEFQELKSAHYRPSIKPGVMEQLRAMRERMLKLNHRGR